ncbi:MAG: hypothetical protein P1P76_11640 [Anaerolineales bacterium]|nr:hypothetical protein [Anaerolineales bacterium]
MFDNLRQMSDGEPAFEEPQDNPFDIGEPVARPRRGYFLGLRPSQRLILSLLLLGTVIVMGLMCLMVTGRVFVF